MLSVGAYLGLGVAGLAGVFARFGANLWLTSASHPLGWPWATWSVNLLGSFCIGIAHVLATERGWWSPELRLAVVTGFLGGFTTFSSYTLETLRMLETPGYRAAAIGYFVLSPLGGLGAALLGATIARRF